MYSSGQQLFVRGLLSLPVNAAFKFLTVLGMFRNYDDPTASGTSCIMADSEFGRFQSRLFSIPTGTCTNPPLGRLNLFSRNSILYHELPVASRPDLANAPASGSEGSGSYQMNTWSFFTSTPKTASARVELRKMCRGTPPFRPNLGSVHLSQSHSSPTYGSGRVPMNNTLFTYCLCSPTTGSTNSGHINTVLYMRTRARPLAGFRTVLCLLLI